MLQYLDNPLDIKLLKSICSGTGVEINISFFAEKFHKHRNTIKSKIDNLLNNRVIEKPLFPFNALLNELSLLVIEKINLPRDPKTNKWIEEDPHIWAAYFVKEEEYNTLLIELHQDFFNYQIWKEKIFNDELITIDPEQVHYYEPIFSSTKSIIKNKPEDSIRIIKKNFRNKANPFIGNLKFDELSIEILKMLLNGKGIRTNENQLSKKLNVHRKTIQRRIDLYLRDDIVGTPKCMFPRIWSPPLYFTVLSLLQIKRCKQRNRIVKSLTIDPHVAFITKINSRNYDFAMLSNFYKIADHLEWVESYNTRFQNCVGAIKNTYLSPSMAFSIDYNYVTNIFLENQLKRIRGKEYLEFMNIL